MDRLEYFHILLQDVAAWNAWRAQHEDLRPDFSHAYLSNANLRRAYLSNANLSDANLRHASLSDANLSGADLSGADLSGANLSRANLSGADLSRADLSVANLNYAVLNHAVLNHAVLNHAVLSGAVLRRAYLSDANLSDANLTGADISEVSLWGTVFGNTTLTAMRGLETCHHSGPSTLDHRTLAKSGPLPLTFLRGCGLPEQLIEYLPSLLGETMQFYSCFISYSTADEDFCRRLHRRLQDAGLRVWFAPHDIQGGRKIHEQIDQAIRVYDKLLLVLSPHSMQSPWVEFEIRRARRREVAEQRRLLFPVRLIEYDAIKRWECFDADTARDLATEIREYYITDFTAWKDHDAFEAAVTRLLHDLKTEHRQA
jgi:hypothetical protein